MFYLRTLIILDLFLVPWQSERRDLQHEDPEEQICKCIFMSATNARDIIQLRR